MFCNIICNKKLRRVLCDNICMVRLGVVCDAQTFECVVKIDKDQWMYESIMSEEVHVNE